MESVARGTQPRGHERTPYLEQMLGRGALVDGVTFVLLLSVVGHADLLRERNGGSDL